MIDILRGCEFELINGVNYYRHDYVVNLENKILELEGANILNKNALKMHRYNQVDLSGVCYNCGAVHPEEKSCFKFWIDMYHKTLDKLVDCIKLLNMVENNSLMPHQHIDYQTRLYCLAEMASELIKKLEKVK